MNHFTTVTMPEQAQVVRSLPLLASDSDGITVTMINKLYKSSPCDLLNIMNYSLNIAWIPYVRKIPKVIPIPKKTGIRLQT